MSVEPVLTVEFTRSEAEVVTAILTTTGVKAAQAKIAQGQAQAKLEAALGGPQPEEAPSA